MVDPFSINMVGRFFLRAYVKAVFAAGSALQQEMRRLQEKYDRDLRRRHSSGTATTASASVKRTSQSEVLSFCRQLVPFDVKGYEKIRLGNNNDGGYIFIDDFTAVSTVISCGISNDVTCDYAFAELGKTVLQFDHTVDGPPTPHDKFQFRKQAIDASGLIPGSVKLWDVVSESGNQSQSDLLLKIDIEGHEWATFAECPPDALNRFRQISCELHEFSRLRDPAYYSLCLRAIENISTVFFPVHLHANNFRGFANVAGVAIPEVLEVTFANRNLYVPSAKRHVLPTELDRPNDADTPDLFLGSPFSSVDQTSHISEPVSKLNSLAMGRHG